MLHLLTETNLWPKLRSGDPDTWRRFTQRALPRIENRLRAYGVSPNDAAAEALEVLLKMYEHPPSDVSDPRAVHNWLNRVIRNQARDYLRGRKRKKNQLELLRDLQPLTNEDEGLELEVEDPRPNPERALLRRELGEQVRDALTYLHPEIHRTMRLYHLQGYSAESVSFLQNVPATTVRTRLMRGARVLREELQDYLKT